MKTGRKIKPMRGDNKRWLMSVMKTSGSRRTHVINARYAEEIGEN